MSPEESRSSKLHCNACAMTDRGIPGSPEYDGIPCWSLTDLMKKGGKLVTATEHEMIRSSSRLKSKLPTDGVGEFNGPAPKTFDDCSNVQKRLVCYHNIFRFLYGVGIAGVRIPLPSCCVLRIQTEYPDALNPPNEEEGFIEDSFVDGLKNF